MEVKENDTLGKMFEEMELEFKNSHPVFWWIDNVLFKGKGLFSYAPHYSLTHPHVLLVDMGRKIKWAYQRVVRQYDDRVSWSLDQWLDGIVPNILMMLKENKYSVPHEIFEKDEMDENGDVSKENFEKARGRWNEELDKMIAGFVASKKLRDLDYNWKDKEEEQAIKKIFDEGMQSFIKHYHSLWD